MKQDRRRLARLIAMICGAALSGMLITWLLMLVLGISIPLNGLRQPVETAATRALGQQVSIDGALRIKPTLPPALIMHDVRITNPNIPGGLLHAARVVAQLAPFTLLRGEQSHSSRLLFEDTSINLDTSAAAAHSAGETDAGIHHRLISAGAELLAKQPGLQQLVMRRVVLNSRDENTGQPGRVELDELSVQTGPGQALKLQLRGRIQQQLYTIDVTGGRLADLLTPAASWPLQAVVSFADTRLLLDGNLESSRQALAMAFELQADWPAGFERLAVHLGQTPLPGRLSLRTDQGRNILAGELQLPALDAVLHLGEGAVTASDANALPVDGGQKQADGPVSVPLTVSIAEVPFHGLLRVAGYDTETVLELALAASDADANRLLTTLTGIAGIHGRVRRIGIRASARSGNSRRMANRVALTLQVNGAKLSYGNAAGKRPVAVAVDELALSLPAGDTVSIHARGTLLEEPFTVELESAGLAELLMEDTWPITLHATGSGAVLDASGPLAVHGILPTRLHVGLYGERIGDLAAWLGVSPCAAAPYTLRGELVLARDIGRLQFLQVQTETTRLSGELDWSGDDRIALLHAVLQFETLDPADIEALFPLVSQVAATGSADRGIAFDIPLLPGPIEIINADIDLDIAHILLKLVDISGVSLTAKIRDGKLQRSPFETRIGSAAYQGYLDPAAAETGVVFEYADDDGAAGGVMDKLLSSAVRWVGSNAVVPMRWFFRKKMAAGADCVVEGAEAAN